MPGIEVHYRRRLFDERDKGEALRRLREIVRDYGVEVFSAPEVQLSTDDFTFKFIEAERYDHLTHHIIVRIQLHAFKSRLENTDEKSAALAEIIAGEVAQSWLIQVSVGVSILVAEIGWGSATAHN